jgi:hypothetical protein
LPEGKTVLGFSLVNIGYIPYSLYVIGWSPAGVNADIGSAPISDKLKGKPMKTVKLIPVLAAFALAAPVFAQTAAEVQANVNQQQRIENGLKSGQLTTREAAKLEREEAQVGRTEAKAMRDGSLSDAEKARIGRMQQRVSGDIYAQKHDAQTGNPTSASSQRMQADVQRNIDQQKRIEAGIGNGSLTNREAGRLERGQARVERGQFRAGSDGHVGAAEQQHIQRAENRQSRRIHRQKHDGQSRG